MKHRLPIVITLLLSLVAVLMISGCAGQSATKRLTLANEAYTGVLKSINDLHDAGRFSTAQMQQVEPYRQTAAAALDKAKAARDAGNTTDLEQALAAAEGAIESLVSQRNAAAGTPAP